MDELYRKLTPEMRRPKPSADAIAAALEAAQRLAAENDAEQAADDTAQELQSDSSAGVCRVCGYHNRGGNKFCGMCGVAVGEVGEAAAGSSRPERRPSRAIALHPNPFLDPEPEPEPKPNPKPRSCRRPDQWRLVLRGTKRTTTTTTITTTIFPAGRRGWLHAPAGGTQPRRGEDASHRRVARRHEPRRGCGPAHRPRVGAGLQHQTPRRSARPLHRRCLRAAVELFLRSAAPPRFASFSLARSTPDSEKWKSSRCASKLPAIWRYEAGRCKALVPSATGKRREERGKYLWVCARQSNGEWKLAADCWSSDLTLTTLESDVPSGVASKVEPSHGRILEVGRQVSA